MVIFLRLSEHAKKKVLLVTKDVRTASYSVFIKNCFFVILATIISLHF